MPSSSPYSKAAISALVAGLDKRHVWQYLQKVHKIDIVCKGNRNIPSKLEIIKKIHALRNISVVIADIQRMKLMKLEKPGSKLESDEDDEEKDEEGDEEGAGQQEADRGDGAEVAPARDDDDDQRRSGQGERQRGPVPSTEGGVSHDGS